LAVQLAHGEALLHVGKEKDSAAMSERALALAERAPALAPYRTLAIDHAALANLGADQYARALTLYDAELPSLSAAENPVARRNRFVVRLARAAAAVGAGKPEIALTDLDELGPHLDAPRFVADLASSHVTAEQAVAGYRALAAGLRANASAALGELDASAAALARQRELLEARLERSNRNEDLRAVTLVDTRLAENARARHDIPVAARWIALALAHADTLAARTHVALDIDQLRVLWFAATLGALDHAALPFDLHQRLIDAQQKIVAQHGHAFRLYERWFEIFLALGQPNR
jgi:hypothetical protein